MTTSHTPLRLGLLLSGLILFAKTGAALPGFLYDCTTDRPEAAGFHNMVLFGDPADALYAYHLPLFTGEANGKTGHVLMHTYQALWKIDLDKPSKEAYAKRYLRLVESARLAWRPDPKNQARIEPPEVVVPFFSLAPSGKRFKVPELICGELPAVSATVVSGHVEGNPDFPAAEPILPAGKKSEVKVVGETVFARRFDEKPALAPTYLLFGTEKQLYAAHFLTDDENSFDHIVAIDTPDAALKTAVQLNPGTLVSVAKESEKDLLPLPETERVTSANNRFKLPITGKNTEIVIENSLKEKWKIRALAEVYFNRNSDLHK